VLFSFIILALIFLQPVLNRSISSDFDRHLVTEDYLSSPDNNEEILIFGDSRSMFGADSRVVRKELHIKKTGL